MHLRPSRRRRRCRCRRSQAAGCAVGPSAHRGAPQARSALRQSAGMQVAILPGVHAGHCSSGVRQAPLHSAAPGAQLEFGDQRCADWTAVPATDLRGRPLRTSCRPVQKDNTVFLQRDDVSRDEEQYGSAERPKVTTLSGGHVPDWAHCREGTCSLLQPCVPLAARQESQRRDLRSDRPTHSHPLRWW